MKAVVLFSGGMDSCAALYKADADGAEEIIALTLGYGSRHMGREMRAAKQVVEWLKARGWAINHAEAALNHDLFVGAGSALIAEDGVEVPHADYAPSGPQPTIVPFRNANLISAATALAVTHDYQTVYAAMHASDHLDWAYPDCSPEFLGAMANAVHVGTMQQVRLVTPFVWFDKAQIVSWASALPGGRDIPWELTYSCYVGGELHCGECPTCRERQRAFSWGLGYDPTEYVNTEGVF